MNHYASRAEQRAIEAHAIRVHRRHARITRANSHTWYARLWRYLTDVIC
ncbi:MAG: hypothetical protein JSS14_21995 [Proteobacteria bacterium]|nr:hypothetical protein [Pseudomonadota bacterium]